MTLNNPSPVAEDAPTEIFLPEFHFPREHTVVEVSGGKWSITIDEDDRGMELIQRLRWWHGIDEQKITIKGLKRKMGQGLGSQEEEEGYIAQCQQTASKCTLM